MTRRLLVSYLTITLIVLVMLMVPLGVFYAQRERERLAADVEHDASVVATLYEDDLEAQVPLDPIPADTYEDRTGARVVVVDIGGISRVDTGDVIARDFSTRPEIIAALAGERSSGTRRSDTLGTDLLYVAVPVASGGTVHGALRITLDTADVSARIRNFWIALGGIAIVVLAAVALIGWVIARSVARPLRELTSSAARFADGDLSVGGRVSEGPSEIRALDETMALMANRLDGVLTTQRRFVADASHQLRTPLTALRLRLENLQSELSETEQHGDGVVVDDSLERAIAETDRLGELVANLLQLARVDERAATRVGASSVAESVDLAALVRDRVDTWTAMAEERHVALRSLVAPGSVMVRCIGGSVEQMLDNLLDNALAFSTAGGGVEVDVHMGADTVHLHVVDHGPGLDDEGKVDALGRFWRGDTTRPGTGLGLAIVEALATASGGRVVLADTPGGGLTVVVELPTTVTSQQSRHSGEANASS